MEFCRNRPGSRRWFHRPLLKVRLNFSTDRKLFMILRVFVSSWWIGPGLYHEDAKTQRKLGWSLGAVGLLLLTACAGSRTGRQEASAYRIYVTNENSGDLSVIDSSTHEVIDTEPLGKRPRGIRASADRRTIYVALSGSPSAPPGVDESKLPPPDRSADGIGVFDVRRNKLVRVLPSGTDPEQFDLSKDGSLLYVSNEDAATTSIVDLAAGAVRQTLPVGEEPEGVTLSPDGKFVYVTSENDGAVFVIDTVSSKVIKNFKVGRRPRSVAFLPDGSRAYVTAENDGFVTVVDAIRHEPLRNVPLSGPGVKPMGIVVSADGSRAYVSTGRGKKVFVIDTSTDRAIASFEAGERPWGLAVSPDGKTLYTANGPSNDVSVVDLPTQRVIKKIKVGRGPWGLITLKP